MSENALYLLNKTRQAVEKMEDERDSLRAEVERLKAAREADIAAAVEAERSRTYKDIILLSEEHPYINGMRCIQMEDIFGAWRPATEQSSTAPDQ